MLNNQQENCSLSLHTPPVALQQQSDTVYPALQLEL